MDKPEWQNLDWLCFIPSGLSPRDLILHFRHKVKDHSDHNNDNSDDDDGCVSDCVVFWIFTLQVLILFKLILLEKKVSVGTVCCLSEGLETKLTLTSCLSFLPPTSAGAVLCVSRQQTGRRTDDGPVTVPRSESLLSLSEWRVVMTSSIRCWPDCGACRYDRARPGGLLPLQAQE